MTDLWNRVERLFAEAVRLNRTKRSEFLARACGDDDDLRCRLDSLLMHSDESRSLVQDVVGGARDGDTALHGDTMPLETLPPDPEIDKLLEQVILETSERLLVAEPLGAGGMGEVEAVVDRGLQRRIARKVISSSLCGTSDAVKLFLREAQISSQLDHPAIVPVHELGRDSQGRAFFTMKLVDGRSLTEIVSGMPPGTLGAEDLQRLLEVVIRVCDALDFAHSRGVTHGDIKPDNIMVGSFGEVYLLDWGLAQLQPDAVTRTSAALAGGTVLAAGTPGFMAPEQAQAAPLDARTDVFLVGALLYYCLARRAPYGGGSVVETLVAAKEARWQPELIAGSSPDLVRIVGTAMQKAPEARYQTIAELRRELKVLLHGGAELSRRHVQEGEHIIREGETGQEVFVLEQGRARAYQNVNGREIDLRDMVPGDVFGEMAILTSSRRTASVVAVESCTLRVITGETLERELGGMKPWLAALTKTLALKLRERESESD